MDKDLDLPTLLFSDFNIPEVPKNQESSRSMVLSITSKKTYLKKQISSNNNNITSENESSSDMQICIVQSQHECKCQICNQTIIKNNNKQNNHQDLDDQLDNYNDIVTFINVKSKGFEEISGMSEVKDFLKQAIIYPIKFPHLFNGSEKRVPWTRAILFGAPGVGKTALMHATAAEANLPLYQVSSADLTSSWIGETEKLIRRLFQTLGGTKCILVLDEVDALCRKRSGEDSTHCRKATNELLIQIDRYEDSPMFLLCATNCPWDIDNAFLRRFQKRIYVPLPDCATRESIILKNISSDSEFLNTFITNATWGRFLKATDGFTGSDLKNLIRSALMRPVQDLEENKYWKKTLDGNISPANPSDPDAMECSLNNLDTLKVCCRPVNMDDLWKCLENTDKTVTDECIKPFQDFVNNRKVNK